MLAVHLVHVSGGVAKARTGNAGVAELGGSREDLFIIYDLVKYTCSCDRRYIYYGHARMHHNRNILGMLARTCVSG